MDDIKIQIRFSIEDFNDALYFTLEEYKKLSQREIEKMKQQRYENYKNNLKNRTISVEPTEEQLIEEAKSINDQLIQLSDRKDEIAQIVDLSPEILTNPIETVAIPDSII